MILYISFQQQQLIKACIFESLLLFSRPYLSNGQAYGMVFFCGLFVRRLYSVMDVLWLSIRS